MTAGCASASVHIGRNMHGAVCTPKRATNNTSCYNLMSISCGAEMTSILLCDALVQTQLILIEPHCSQVMCELELARLVFDKRCVVFVYSCASTHAIPSTPISVVFLIVNRTESGKLDRTIRHLGLNIIIAFRIRLLRIIGLAVQIMKRTNPINHTTHSNRSDNRAEHSNQTNQATYIVIGQNIVIRQSDNTK